MALPQFVRTQAPTLTPGGTGEAFILPDIGTTPLEEAKYAAKVAGDDEKFKAQQAAAAAKQKALNKKALMDDYAKLKVDPETTHWRDTQDVNKLLEESLLFDATLLEKDINPRTDPLAIQKRSAALGLARESNRDREHSLKIQEKKAADPLAYTDEWMAEFNRWDQMDVAGKRKYAEEKEALGLPSRPDPEGAFDLEGFGQKVLAGLKPDGNIGGLGFLETPEGTSMWQRISEKVLPGEKVGVAYALALRLNPDAKRTALRQFSALSPELKKSYTEEGKKIKDADGVPLELTGDENMFYKRGLQNEYLDKTAVQGGVSQKTAIGAGMKMLEGKADTFVKSI